MKSGGGKQKGGSWERECCVRLSLWITNGERQDCLWRSAMSGGRATVRMRTGTDVRQGGDITAVSPEGHRLTDKWLIECKHVKDLSLSAFFIKGGGLLRDFWNKLILEAARHSKDPMLIAKQNNWPALVFSKHNHVAHWVPPILTYHGHNSIDVTLFREMTDHPFDVNVGVTHV